MEDLNDWTDILAVGALSLYVTAMVSRLRSAFASPSGEGWFRDPGLPTGAVDNMGWQIIYALKSTKLKS